MAEPAISLHDVTFSYGGAPALTDVNLSIDQRQAVCVVGPNGGGKTTLVKLILGLLKPQRGDVRVFGEPPDRARLRIGYMPQHVQHDPQFPVAVMDIVLMGRLGQSAAGASSAGPVAAIVERPPMRWRRSAWNERAAGRLPRFPAASGSGY